VAAGAALSEGASPGELLEMADRLLRHPDPSTAGLWPRASALLALDALEACLRGLWERHALELAGCSMRTQLLCLRGYLDETAVATRASHAWSALSRACHHHVYELAPTAAELDAWIASVRELARVSK
jgi:hypothetical protein